MGFTLQLVMELPIDAELGRPSLSESTAVIPSCHRPFINQKGSFFTCYIPDTVDSRKASPQELLDNYPCWDDVVEEVVARGHSWKETDHTAFREALHWFAEFDYYAFHWSY